MPKIYGGEQGSSQVEYGVFDLETVHLDFLSPTEQVSSLDKDKSGRYLILSHQGDKEYWTIWDPKFNAVLFRNERHTSFIHDGLKRCFSARFLPVDGMVMFADASSTNLTIFDVYLNQSWSTQCLHSTVISHHNKTRLITYDSSCTMRIYNLTRGNISMMSEYSVDSLLQDTANMRLEGMCVVPARIPRVAFCFLNRDDKRGSIHIAAMNFFSSTLIPQERIELPSAVIRRCSHEKGIFSLPDGKLVFTINYCPNNEEGKRGDTKKWEINRAADTIIFSPNQHQWIVDQQVLADPRQLKSWDRSSFPYLLGGDIQPSVIPEITSVALPSQGHWKVLYSLCTDNTFYKKIPFSSNHHYIFCEVAEINLEFLQQVLGQHIAEGTKLSKDAVLLTSSYILKSIIFDSNTLRKAAILRHAPVSAEVAHRENSATAPKI